MAQVTTWLATGRASSHRDGPLWSNQSPGEFRKKLTQKIVLPTYCQGTYSKYSVGIFYPIMERRSIADKRLLSIL